MTPHQSIVEIDVGFISCFEVRMSTYKEVKRIAFENDEKIVDVLEKIIREGLAKRK